MLPIVETALVVPYGPGVCDTTTGALPNRWKSRGGRGASGSRAVCFETDLRLVRCRDKHKYQRRLAGWFADVSCRPEVPIAVVTDLLVLADNLGQL